MIIFFKKSAAGVVVLLLFVLSLQLNAFSHSTALIQISEAGNVSIDAGTTFLVPQCREDVSFEDHVVQLSSVTVLKNFSSDEFVAKCSNSEGVNELVELFYSTLNRTGDICNELENAFDTCQSSIAYCEELKQAAACPPKEEKLMQQCLQRFELNNTEDHCEEEFQRNSEELTALCGEEFVTTELVSISGGQLVTERNAGENRGRGNEQRRDAKQEEKSNENANRDPNAGRNEVEPERGPRRNGSNEVVIAPSPDSSGDNQAQNNASQGNDNSNAGGNSNNSNAGGNSNNSNAGNNSNSNNSNAGGNSGNNNSNSGGNAGGNSGGRGNSQTPNIISGFVVGAVDPLCNSGRFVQTCQTEVQRTKLLLRNKAEEICSAEVNYNVEVLNEVCGEIASRRISCAASRRRDSVSQIVCEEERRENNCRSVISSNCGCLKNKLNRCVGLARFPDKLKAVLTKSVQLECAKQTQLLNQSGAAEAVEGFEAAISDLVFEDEVMARKELQKIVEATAEINSLRSEFLQQQRRERLFRVKTLLGLQAEAIERHAFGLNQQLSELNSIDTAFCEKLTSEGKEKCLAGKDALETYKNDLGKEIDSAEREKGGIVSALAQTISPS